MVELRHIKSKNAHFRLTCVAKKTSLLKFPYSLSKPHIPDIIIHLYHLVNGYTNLPSIFSYHEKALFCANKPCYFLLQ